MVALLAALISIGVSSTPELGGARSLGITEPLAAPVVISGGTCTGSGFVWDAAAHQVMTALHVVEAMPADAIRVIAAGAAARARIVDREPALDLALLEVEGAVGDAPPVAWSGALAAGETVTIPGCGRSQCMPIRGRVVAASRAFAGSRYVALQASVAPGSSGGPVMSEDGAVVAIVDLVLLREPGIALAVPIERAAARFPRVDRGETERQWPGADVPSSLSGWVHPFASVPGLAPPSVAGAVPDP